MPIIVNPDACTGCESCLECCPYDAIEMRGEKAFINELCQICNICIETCPEGAISKQKDDAAPEAHRTEGFDGFKGVWVYAEQRDGLVSQVSHELLGAGRILADDLGVELAAVVIGAGEDAGRELIAWGADKVYVADDTTLQDFNDLHALASRLMGKNELRYCDKFWYKRKVEYEEDIFYRYVSRDQRYFPRFSIMNTFQDILDGNDPVLVCTDRMFITVRSIQNGFQKLNNGTLGETWMDKKRAGWMARKF